MIEQENEGNINPTMNTEEVEMSKYNGWISVDDELPETLETVWISNGNGWTTLGCRSDYYEGDDGELVWCWAATSGIIYEEDGEIVSECEGSDLDVKYWHRLPIPINNNHNPK